MNHLTKVISVRCIYLEVEYRYIPEQISTMTQEPIDAHIEVYGTIHKGEDILDILGKTEIDYIESELLKMGDPDE